MIAINNVSKVYSNGISDFKALHSINLHIKINEYIALMGPSGSGKSTLMNILGALDLPSSGSYRLNHTDVHKMNDEALSRFRNKEIGFVFQTFNLLNRLSAEENVALPLLYNNISKRERLDKARKMLERVGIADKAKNKPGEMSGGQRQRVAIARALINEPSIILADEPTGNLDSKTSLDIMQLFKELHLGGQTIIIVTHEEEIATYAQKTIRLKDGQIVTS